MVSFSPTESLRKFQVVNHEIYGLSDDRLFSLNNLLANQSRFSMRALKGIRKGKKHKLTMNLMIATSWTMAICNRLHIDIEEAVWERFPYVCSYCGHGPCTCKAEKPTKRTRILRKDAKRPNSLAEFQAMFATIYPPESRTLADSGVHFAEEVGEVQEAVNFFKGEHKVKQFEAITLELADWISCMFGVANSAGIDVAKELATMFHNNCHVCHHAPCTCTYSSVAKYSS